MNKIPERSLLSLLKNYKDGFQDLLRSSGYTSIHQRCIKSLLTEVFKYIHGLSSEIMNEVFSTTASIYNTQHLMFSKPTPTYLEQIWIKFDTLKSQPTLELTS